MKDSVLDTYEKVSLKYAGNSNSLHRLGLQSKKLEEAASKQILDVLGLVGYEVIYTSGRAENFSTILSNSYGKIVTDNNNFLEIGKEMNKDIVSISDYSLGEDIYLVSLVSEDIEIDSRYKHIDVDLNKEYYDLNHFDFITISDEIPFFGVLIKRKNLEITNLIHGGKSSTKYRSGTAATPLIASFAKLLKIKYKK